MGIFCLCLGLVYSQLFSTDIHEYLPFISVGLIFWGFISSIINESPNIFVDNGPYIKEMKINLFTVLLRVVFRHFIVFLHNLVIIVAVFFYLDVHLNIINLLFIPAFFLVLIVLVFIALVLGLVGARYRDVSSLTQSVMQLLFFLTPLTWQPSLLANHKFILTLNPIASFIDLLRSPLLGHSPAVMSWIVIVVMLLFLGVLAHFLYKKAFKKITFWI